MRSSGLPILPCGIKLVHFSASSLFSSRIYNKHRSISKRSLARSPILTGSFGWHQVAPSTTPTVTKLPPVAKLTFFVNAVSM